MLLFGDVSRDASPIIRPDDGRASLETSPESNMIQGMINSDNIVSAHRNVDVDRVNQP